MFSLLASGLLGGGDLESSRKELAAEARRQLANTGDVHVLEPDPSKRVSVLIVIQRLEKAMLQVGFLLIELHSM